MIKKNITEGSSSPILESGASIENSYREENHYYSNGSESDLSNFTWRGKDSFVFLNFSSETLAVTRLLSKIKTKNLDLSQVEVTIQGIDNRNKSEIILNSNPSNINLDGYIRNFNISNFNKNLDVGGSNASLEIIAAKNISLVIPSELFDDRVFQCFLKKDLKIVLEECEDMNLSLPGLALANELYKQMCSLGDEDLGTHALIKVLRKMNNM